MSRGLRPLPLQEPAPAPPDVKAASAILIDAATGTILWERESRVRRPQASTTKIVTADLILASGRLDEEVTISEYATRTEYANLNAKPGERIPLRDLLSAILLRSSNDACVAAAEHLAGQPWRFVARMNLWAKQVGANDTNFVTTNGLYHPQHYSTAFDLALLAREASRQPLFNEIVASRQRWIRRTQNQDDLLIQNHNRFLARYQGADGIKTGYVRQSGRCLVASATLLEQGRPWRLLAVLLNSSDTYGDAQRLIDWGRLSYQPVYVAQRGSYLGRAEVRGGERKQAALVTADDLTLVLPRRDNLNISARIESTPSLQAPVIAGYAGGKVQAVHEGAVLGEVPLVTSRAIEPAPPVAILSWTLLTALLAVTTLGPRYARAFAKSPRRGGSRLPASRGGIDYRRESLG